VTEEIRIANLVVGVTGDSDDATSALQDIAKMAQTSLKRLQGSVSGASETLENIDENLEDVANSATHTGARIELLERAFDELRNIKDIATETARLGATSLRAAERLEKFAGSGYASVTMLDAFNRGSDNTVDKMTAMTYASGLLQQGIVDTSTEMEFIVEVATRLGDQTVGATTRIEKLSQLLRNQSIKLLDDFGVSSGVVKDKIEKLQAATAGLSREQAFEIAFFEEARKSLDILGERQDNYATSIERMDAKLKDARVEIGEKLAPAMGALAEIISKMDAGSIMLASSLTGVLGIATKLSGGFGNLATKLGTSTLALGGLTVALFALVGAMAAVNNVNKEFAEGEKKVVGALHSWSNEASAAIASGDELKDVVADLGSRARETQDILHANGNALEDLATTLVRVRDGEKITNETLERGARVIAQHSDSLEEANQMVAIFNEKLGDSEIKLDKFTAASLRAAAATPFKDLVGTTTGAVQEMMDTLKESTDVIAGHEASTSRYAAAADDYVAKYTEISEMEKRRIDGIAAMMMGMEDATVIEEAHNDALRQAIEIEEARIAAIENRRQSQLDLNESLMDASRQEFAQTAIEQIKQKQEAGLITFDKYAAAVVEIQDKFGLADDASRAMTLGLGELVEGFETDKITDMANALELLYQDAQDGAIAFDAIIEKVNQLGDSAGNLADVANVINMGNGSQTGGVFNAATGQWQEASPTTGGGAIYDASTGQFSSGPGPSQAQQLQQGGVTIYGGLSIEGVQDVEGLLEQLQSFMPPTS